MLKPQDILVVLKLATLQSSPENQTFSSVADSIGMSASETHAAVKRAIRCHLLSYSNRQGNPRALPTPAIGHLLRFTQAGLPYVFPAEKGGVAYGLPTGIGAPPLDKLFVIAESELPPVWPHPNGRTKGLTLKPLYRSCPIAAQNDPQLYPLLCLVDAIRDDCVRLRQTALAEFENLIRSFAAKSSIALT